MSRTGVEQHGDFVVELTGGLTLATMAEARSRLLLALQGGRAVKLDCAGATAFDVSFVQLLEAARSLASRLGSSLHLAAPVPAALAQLFAEGGFRDWSTRPGGSAA